MKITGPFDVTMNPEDSHTQFDHGMIFGRMRLEKTYHGALAATARGEMISARTPVQSSAGYVAIEQVEGTLDGKTGSFVLQHFGVMNDGKSRLILEVIPNSGTGELTGLAGSMVLENENGQHSYSFTYEL